MRAALSGARVLLYGLIGLLSALGVLFVPPTFVLYFNRSEVLQWLSA